MWRRRRRRGGARRRGRRSSTPGLGDDVRRRRGRWDSQDEQQQQVPESLPSQVALPRTTQQSTLHTFTTKTTVFIKPVILLGLLLSGLLDTGSSFLPLTFSLVHATCSTNHLSSVSVLFYLFPPFFAELNKLMTETE